MNFKDIRQFIYNSSRVPKIPEEGVAESKTGVKVNLEIIIAMCQYYVLI